LKPPFNDGVQTSRSVQRREEAAIYGVENATDSAGLTEEFSHGKRTGVVVVVMRAAPSKFWPNVVCRTFTIRPWFKPCLWIDLLLAGEHQNAPQWRLQGE